MIYLLFKETVKRYIQLISLWVPWRFILYLGANIIKKWVFTEMD